MKLFTLTPPVLLNHARNKKIIPVSQIYFNIFLQKSKNQLFRSQLLKKILPAFALFSG